MGGTFNPIHIGHLVCAEEALNQYGLKQVVFMPTGLHPWSKPAAAEVGAELRFKMTQIATSDNPRFVVSHYELDRLQPSYTVETLRHYREEMPEAELFFITGADSVLEIIKWKDPEELLGMATLIAATRPGYSLERLSTQVGGFLKQNRVKIMEIPSIGISSSLIRERVAKGMSIKYLVPEGVLAFIEKERLYRQA
jgi:nicotinate-nucleotide adenylyltransferase